MTLISSPAPVARTRLSDHPTMLFSWWCTSFAATLIIMRVLGRKIRTNRLFSEDIVMAASMIPLFIRMGLIQVVLFDGTNNVQTAGLTAAQIRARETGSKYVLASRIFFAMFIWMSKFTVYEFLKRTFYRTWQKRYETILKAIRAFLVLTFIAIVIATLAECTPFDHYWQVVPDPGPQCRQGYAQLLTMGVADIVTDILLVAFPIPIILRSLVSPGRKTVLILLFSASLLLIGITAARVVEVIRAHGSQQYRTVWASIEILMSAFVSNGITLGSFAKGKGMKRNKYRQGSATDSINFAPTRRGTLASSYNNESVEDLFRSVGCRVPTELVEEAEESLPKRARQIDSVYGDPEKGQGDGSGSRWETLAIPPPGRSGESTHHLAAFLRNNSPRSPDLDGPGSASLRIADVGGLLGNDKRPSDGSITTKDFARSSMRQPAPSPILTDLRTSFRGRQRRSLSQQRSLSPRATSRPRSEHTLDSDLTTPINNASASKTSSQSHSIEFSDVGGLLK